MTGPMAGSRLATAGIVNPEGTPDVKLDRYGAIAGLALVSAVALTGCATDKAPAASGDSKSDCATGQISASGSTAQKSAVAEWTTAYGQKCGANVTYDAQGSGQGIKDFTAGKVAFAGSDSSLKPEEQTAADARCKTGKAIHLPLVAGPIAIVYNIKGVDKLTLTPTVIAQIFAGKLTKWNDPAIAAANSGVTLPATTITTFHRSKDSGTTDNLAKFLGAAASADWTFGAGKAWKAPGGQGAPDSAGIVSAVNGTDGAVSYVDNPDAKKNNLKAASIDFGSGPVAITDASVGKAVAAAEKTGSGDDIKLSLKYDLKDAGAYPLALVTYEITCAKGLPADQAKVVKGFLGWVASDEGQAKLSPIGYSPIPAEVLTDVRKSIAAIS
jgi:phosphate transport system substrate-binding protein